MDWQTLDARNKDLFQTYEKKYGLSSDFQKAQKIMYAYPEIHSSFLKALSWMTIKQGSVVLDIGVNNGYELNLLEEHYSRELMDTLEFLGFDLAEDALLDAQKRFASVNRPNFKFIKGNIQYFVGIDVRTKEIVEINDQSIDAVVALTSLQSSSLAEKLNEFIDMLVKKMKNDGQLFTAVPNCHVGLSGEIIKGAFDAAIGKISETFAEEFSNKLISIMALYGFQYKKIGEAYIFLYFFKTPLN